MWILKNWKIKVTLVECNPLPNSFTRWDLHHKGLSRFQWPPLLPLATTCSPPSAAGKSGAVAHRPASSLCQREPNVARDLQNSTEFKAGGLISEWRRSIKVKIIFNLCFTFFFGILGLLGGLRDFFFLLQAKGILKRGTWRAMVIRISTEAVVRVTKFLNCVTWSE